MKEKNLKYYLNLNYRIKVDFIEDQDDGNYWIAEYPILKGCKTEGETKAEAISNVKQLFEEYIIDRLEIDDNLSEPEVISLQNNENQIWIELPTIEQKSKIINRTAVTDSDKDIPLESHLYQYNN